MWLFDIFLSVIIIIKKWFINKKGFFIVLKFKRNLYSYMYIVILYFFSVGFFDGVYKEWIYVV